MEGSATDSAGRVSVADLARVTEAFRAVFGAAVQARAARSDGSMFAPSSTADREAESEQVEATRDDVEDLLSITDIKIAALLDHSDLLLALLRWAVEGRPTPAYAPYGIARSVVELAGDIYWLLRADIQPKMRFARALTTSHQEIKSQQRLPGVDLSEAESELLSDAGRLGLELVGRGFQAGFAEPLPSRTARVASVTSEPWVYSVLSAAAHGEQWMLFSTGFTQIEASGDKHILTKSPPAAGYSFAATQALAAFVRAVWVDSAYRGWDTDVLRPAFRQALSQAGLSPEWI